MVTVNSNDSIFWEEAGNGEASVRSRLISEEDMVKQASEFAGTVPVKYLLPYWKTGNRYLFSGGSVNMRDAAIYAKEENWSKAIELWKQTYETLAREKSKTDKKETGEIQDGTVTYYIFTSMYVDELEKRKEGMARLNMQMNRFNDDF